jgi:cyclophilin family peptidyl-prolyl cis-trans isomerase
VLIISGCVPPIPPADNGNFPDRTPLTANITASDTNVVAGQRVSLEDADRLADDGTVAHSWSQTSGPGVKLQNANTREASFGAPSSPVDAIMTFVMSVSNSTGGFGSAEIALRVAADEDYVDPDGPADGSSGGETDDEEPVADAGQDQTVREFATVMLNGESSTGRSIVFSWTSLDAAITITEPNSPTPSFTAPAFAEDGVNSYTFELRVTDDQGQFSTDQVIVTVLRSDDSQDFPEVLLETSLGNMRVRLNRVAAPVTVANFLSYADSEFYDGLIFHRVISGFVIQGGGYFPGLTEKPPNDPIVLETSDALLNERGTIAMARTSDPDSATSQFYFNLVDNPDLDPNASSEGYAVFGEITEGLEVMDAIGAVSTQMQNGFNDVPVNDILIIRIRRVEQ